MQELEPEQWKERQRQHRARVEAWTAPHLDRRGRAIREPVGDFLFTYYSFRPAVLARWTPGLGVRLLGPEAEAFLERRHFVHDGAGVSVTPRGLPATRVEGLSFILQLLRAVEARPAHLACHGLHEWCMVHRDENIRHRQVPLRLAPERIAALVESQPVACTHFDAYRFFTPAARPLNRWPLRREDQAAFDQPGCLHANMDLYKWAGKMLPFAPSELVADCFALAREARTVDMRASPYDLRTAGLDPIPVETPEGRQEYVREQLRIQGLATPLRRRLIQTAENLLAAL